MEKSYSDSPGASVVQVFHDVAARYPDRTAVKLDAAGDCREISYSGLAEQAERVADRLVRAGLKQGEPVVLPSIRSADLCANLLGILWAGGHYVFVDFSYPVERQRFICSQVNARFGIGSEGGQAGRQLPIEWLESDQAGQVSSSIPLPVDPESSAYVMFTSGSTGEPKGVIIPHRAIVRLVVESDFMRFDENLVFLHHSALSFDASTLEIWGPLLNGGTVVVFDPESHPTPEVLQQCVETCGVNALWLTSSLYNSFISEAPDSLRSIRQLLIGGEALSVTHVRLGLEKLQQTQIYNGYGPTENTTFTCVYPIPRELPGDIQQIPIGFPINGTKCEVCDEHLKPVQEGETGELIAFGKGLASEYLARPELTTERFVTVECSDGENRRGYRTGDLVTRRPDGAYEYHGRKDKQVKIHRIEPGEIEYFLNDLSGITDARVVVKVGPKGQKRLAGYLVSDDQLQMDAVRKALSDKFPAFMVPHFLIQLGALPKNQNGKLDEGSLPDPFEQSSPRDRAKPGDFLAGVADCWSQVLGRDVSHQANFLEAGGTSLEAMELTRKLKQKFSIELQDTFVFEYSSINSQARYLSESIEPATTVKTAQQVNDAQHHIAVVGMACRMPGAENVDEYWDNLLNGTESITFFEQDELSQELDEKLTHDNNYIKAKGVIKDCDLFDEQFFNISPLEAKVMDPQQRLMLEVAWQALEDASACADIERLRIGVFAGMNWPRYYQQYVLPNQEINKRYGDSMPVWRMKRTFWQQESRTS